MCSNCLPNCCCYSDYCNCQDLYGLPASHCCPPAPCCCPYCQRRKPKLSKMATKAKATSIGAAAASRNGAKSKTKTTKSKKVSRNDKPRAEERAFSADAATLKGASAMGSHHSLRSSGSSLRSSNSPRLEKLDSKQKLNLNIMLPKTFNSKTMNENPTTWLCSCCNKTSPMYSYAASPKTSRHSFSGAKTGSQLDVINEVDSDAENNRRQNSSLNGSADLNNFLDVKANAKHITSRYSSNTTQESAASQATKTRKQKSLEDSCADFLNIVCDNVMETVQKSVDGKLREFIIQTTEKFSNLAQKLEENGAAMKYLFHEQAEKTSEQYKRNFEDFYLRLQDLMGKPNETSAKETYDKECQYAESEEEPDESTNISEQVSSDRHDASPQDLMGKPNETSAKETYDKECQYAESEEEATNISEQVSSDTHDASTCDSHENSVKCLSCYCCIAKDNTCYPCPDKETQNETALQPSNRKEAREGGGGLGDIDIQTMDGKRKVKPWHTSMKSKPSQGFGSPQNSSMAKTLKNVCLVTSGKINNLYNSATHSHDWDENNMQPCAIKIMNDTCNKNSDGKTCSPSISDNYDTSGYATEPEDNSEATLINSGRKKLQKKSLKQFNNLKRQAAAANTNRLEAFKDAHNTLDDVSERSSFQAIRRLSRSSLRSCCSSPTRLSRL